MKQDMTIRFANLSDVEPLVSSWREHHAGGRYAHLSFDEVKLAAHMRRLIDDKSGGFCFLVADGKSPVIGALVGQLDTYPFSNDPVARTLFHWVSPQEQDESVAVRLLLAFRRWAENRNAHEILVNFGDREDAEPSAASLCAMGFRPVGGSFLFAGDGGSMPASANGNA